jgi:hypothetical protein
VSARPHTPGDSGAQKVFICYRREDTAAYAGRLYDAMVARFGEDNVFMDVDIAPGVDFVERITEVVSRCLVLIVVMGPRWATVTDEDGEARIVDPDDFVRLEVETALRRSDVTPIPVLVSGAKMPKREALPEPLQPLTRRNALDLSDARWAYDVGRLNSTLDVLLGETPAEREAGADPYPTPMPISPDTPAPTPAAAPTPAPAATASSGAAAPSVSPGSLGWRLAGEGMLVAAAAAVLGRLFAEIFEVGEKGPGHLIATKMLNWGVTWAFVGVALALWLGLRLKRADLPRLAVLGLIVGGLAGAIGAAIWAAPTYLPDEHLSHEWEVRLKIVGQAFTCGLIGTYVGRLWRPPRGGLGLAGGVTAGIVMQLLLNTLDWTTPDQPSNAFAFGLTAVVAVGIVLVCILSTDRQETGAPVGVRAAER